jgi:hypothetical protein
MVGLQIEILVRQHVRDLVREAEEHRLASAVDSRRNRREGRRGRLSPPRRTVPTAQPALQRGHDA